MNDDALWIDCFVREGAHFEIRPAPWRRAWMDATPGQHAYRCLPMVHASSHGWEITCKQGVIARWSGGPLQSDLSLTFLGSAPDGHPPATSAFGSGIVTFRVPALFRTPPGINLWVMGPPNRIKDGVQPLSGIIETDWLTEHGFTMNWKVTRPGVDIFFAAGEPICFFFPIPRGFAEAFTPRLRRFSQAPNVEQDYTTAEQRRRAFQADLDVKESAAHIQPGPDQGARWQQRYYRGIRADGRPAEGHQTRLSLSPFLPHGEEE
jgi:hypothetical protein